MKKTARLSLARSENKRLQRSAYRSYRALLDTLFETHNEDRFKPLADALRHHQVGLAYSIADSLSEQKYSDAWQHFQANQFVALVKKYPFPDQYNTFDPEKEALAKFYKSEEEISLTNSRIGRYKDGFYPLYNQQIQSMIDFIAYTLGHEVPLDSIYDNCGFGPGANVGVTGNATSILRKLSAERWTCSPKALRHAYAAIHRHPQVREALYPGHFGFSSGSASLDREIFKKRVLTCDYNKIAFVPKTVKTHRGIAVEPLLNLFVQKGIDTVMRQRLLRVGIDLSDQSRNQRMAREGSLCLEDYFCTIDLSAASDSISTRLVQLLLPPAWYDIMSDTRSEHYLLEGTQSAYKKFCSMGNGFCFPLETLIFCAACHACGAGRPGLDYSVYGDDIIVRKSVADKVVSLLSFIGFSTNKEKTFLEGPFRESCGADSFAGKDVRPFTLDFALDSVESVFKFLNLSTRNEFSETFFAPVRSKILGLIDSRLHFFRPQKGPENTGIDTSDEHLTSPLCTYLRNGSWSCLELALRPRPDKGLDVPREQYNIALVMAALIGSASNLPFARRRETGTKICRKTYCGATSLWLPPQRV